MISLRKVPTTNTHPDMHKLARMLNHAHLANAGTIKHNLIGSVKAGRSYQGKLFAQNLIYKEPQRYILTTNATGF